MGSHRQSSSAAPSNARRARLAAAARDITALGVAADNLTPAASVMTADLPGAVLQATTAPAAASPATGLPAAISQPAPQPTPDAAPSAVELPPDFTLWGLMAMAERMILATDKCARGAKDPAGLYRARDGLVEVDGEAAKM
ncbi:hypothetical protein C8A05DRAFT_36231 [Staphylotrichum tortipilum]|uniref:Uncharacterized protein n=1 Tax=Staphylotrichum tortipilum TaxID=2831512 RepID=A0AAN6RRC3_9PEZI|nr:hypothetical protein C8A05DRAFT_36231 [Staphylotrichum longicolle]